MTRLYLVAIVPLTILAAPQTETVGELIPECQYIDPTCLANDDEDWVGDDTSDFVADCFEYSSELQYSQDGDCDCVGVPAECEDKPTCLIIRDYTIEVNGPLATYGQFPNVQPCGSIAVEVTDPFTGAKTCGDNSVATGQGDEVTETLIVEVCDKTEWLIFKYWQDENCASKTDPEDGSISANNSCGESNCGVAICPTIGGE